MSGWSDYGDWSSVDKRRLTSLYENLFPLIDAVNQKCGTSFTERWTGWGDTDARNAVDPIALPARLQTILSGGSNYSYNICWLIHDRIDKLMPFFANHTDSGGDWSNATAIPAWDEATMLAAIGDSIRIPYPQTLYEVTAEWVYQQYKILNKLRWTRKRIQPVGYPDPNNVTFGERKGFNADWDAAITEMNADTWHVRHGVFDFGHAASVSYEYQWKYYPTRHRLNMFVTNGSPLDAAADLYFYLIKEESINPLPYENNDMAGDAENTYFKYVTGHALAAGATWNQYMGDYGDATVTKTGMPDPPSYGYSKGWRCRYSIYETATWYNRLAILKYDDSFTYKDW